MPDPPSSSNKAWQTHQDAILRLAQLVQRPVTDAAAAEEMAKAVTKTLSVRSIVELGSRPSDTMLSSWLESPLRCGGWLVAARRADTLSQEVFVRALGCCVYYSALVAQTISDVEALPAGVLQPTPEGHVPGLATWAALAADLLLQDPAPSIGPPATPWPPTLDAVSAATTSRQHAKAVLEEGLMSVWERFFWLESTLSATSSTAVGTSTDWLQPSVLQLADKLMQRVLWSQPPAVVLKAFVPAVPVGAATLLVHPQLAAAAGIVPDPGLASRVVAVVQQGCWWRALASLIPGLAGTKAAADAAPDPGVPQHPSKHCPPYHLEQAYTGQPLGDMHVSTQTETAREVLHLLLMAQLRDVWPWQVARLQQAMAAMMEATTPEGHYQAMCSATACSSSASVGDSGGSSGGGSSNRGNSNSSSSEAGPGRPCVSLLGSSYLPSDFTGWSWVLPDTGICWPLLEGQWPSRTQQQEVGGAEQQEVSDAQQPVTLQQLQLTASALAHADTEEAVTAALLLALLLQRADPGLRASFLAGPGGTALLAAAQYWGYDAGLDSTMEEGAPFTLFIPMEWQEPFAVPRLLAVLGGNDHSAGGEWRGAGALPSLGLLLAWCYLVPAEGWEVEVPAAWGPAPPGYSLAMTVRHYVSLGEAETCMPEVLALKALPCEALHFAPGFTPTPLLLGTLEALLRMSTGCIDDVLLRCILAIVHATVVWMGKPPVICAATISSSSSSSGTNTTTSSSSGSSSGTTTTTSSSSSSGSSSSSCGADRAALLASLASLAVSLRVALQLAEKAVLQRCTGSLKDLSFLSWQASTMIQPCCLVAAKLMQLAAQQLQAPGAHVLPALQLAAAAQRLARVCAELAEDACTVLLQAGDPSLVSLLELCEAPMHLLLGEVVALRNSQPWWQQGTAQQQGSQQPGAAAAQNPGLLSRQEAPSMIAADSSSGDPSSAHGSNLDKVVDLCVKARRIQQCCCIPLQLMGCSHSRCTNLSGPSAQGLVANRRGVVCGGCRVARYCSPACQRADWDRHRHVCRRLAAGTGAGLDARLSQP